MKVVFGLIVVIGAGLAGLYYAGVFDIDPAGDAEAFKNAVKPGMDWTAVADLREPKKVQMYSAFEGPRSPSDFKRDEFAKRASTGYGDGFIFPYNFSVDHVYHVYFDGNGKVTEVIKPRTAKDLYNGNL